MFKLPSCHRDKRAGRHFFLGQRRAGTLGFSCRSGLHACTLQRLYLFRAQPCFGHSTLSSTSTGHHCFALVSVVSGYVLVQLDNEDLVSGKDTVPSDIAS